MGFFTSVGVSKPSVNLHSSGVKGHQFAYCTWCLINNTLILLTEICLHEPCWNVPALPGCSFSGGFCLVGCWWKSTCWVFCLWGKRVTPVLKKTINEQNTWNTVGAGNTAQLTAEVSHSLKYTLKWKCSWKMSGNKYSSLFHLFSRIMVPLGSVPSWIQKSERNTESSQIPRVSGVWGLSTMWRDHSAPDQPASDIRSVRQVQTENCQHFPDRPHQAAGSSLR